MALTLALLQQAGLSSAEAAERLAKYGPNEIQAAEKRNFLQQAWAVIRQPMLLLLLVAGTLNFALSEPLDGAILLSFVVVVISISIYQERKSENAIAALRDLSSPRALVIRDGVQVRIAGNLVVPGDLVVLSEGDRVPADCALILGTNLSAEESMLTGESMPVRKVDCTLAFDEIVLERPGGEATPWLFSGTMVVKGRGIALVKQTGVRTELGLIGQSLASIEVSRTALQVEIDRLVRFIAVLGVAAALIVTVVYALTRGAWLPGILAGIATAMAMLPEEFPVVLTVFLALGAWRLSKSHVLARNSAVIETLGSATVICVDKTGTLTQNQMTVSEYILSDEVHRVASAASTLPAKFHRLAEFAMLASALEPVDPMDKAFRKTGADYLAQTDLLHADYKLIKELPLTESLLCLSHVWQTSSGEFVVAAKGAPEAIAKLCRLTSAELAQLEAQVQTATASGHRVLAVAAAKLPAGSVIPDSQLEMTYELLGLAALQDPVREGVKQAVDECHSAGVRIVMITGDYPGTAIAIAKEIGLDHASGVVTGTELAEMSDEELAIRVRSTSVYARMIPEQKLRLIKAFRANGEVVGMTGDGVNDAPALKAADIGIAMGARGTDVAREAASLVITDDDFTSIVAGVRQGRGIFDNMRKALSYVIAIHIPILGMTLVPVLAGNWPLVMLPVFVAFIELVIDPACSIVFEAEPLGPNAMTRKPRGLGQPIFDTRVMLIAVLQGVAALAAVLVVYLFTLFTGGTENEVRTASFATLVFCNLALIVVNRSWTLSAWATARQLRNPTVKWIMVGTLAGLLLITNVTPIRLALKLGEIDWQHWLLAAVAAILAVSGFEVYKKLQRA